MLRSEPLTAVECGALPIFVAVAASNIAYMVTAAAMHTMQIHALDPSAAASAWE